MSGVDLHDYNLSDIFSNIECSHYTTMNSYIRSGRVQKNVSSLTEVTIGQEGCSCSIHM